VTKSDIFKIQETGSNSAKIIWKADLSSAYPGFSVINALTPTITANGIVVSAAAVYKVFNTNLLLKVGMGLLDRETGKLRYFAEGVEESISVSSVDSSGAI